MHKLLKLYYTLSYLKWCIKFIFDILTDKDCRTLISENKQIRNRFIGRTCFVIGNGPSIINMDLSSIRDIDKFTVNSLYKNKSLFCNLKPNYHTLVDPYFAKLPENEFTDLINNIRDDNPNVVFIVSFEIFKKIKRLKLDVRAIGLYMHDNWYRHFGKKVDLSRMVFGAENVVHAAVYTAMYLGYKEIILIGCELTGIYESFEYNSNKRLINCHAYEDNADEVIKSLTSHDNCEMLEEYARTFRCFRFIKEYAEKSGVKIINATVGGILDVFPKVEFTNIKVYDKYK